MASHDDSEGSRSASTTAASSPTSSTAMTSPIEAPREPTLMVTPAPTIRQRRMTARFAESPQSTLLVTPNMPKYSVESHPPSPTPGTPLPVPLASSIQSSLHALHADELVYLFKNRSKILGPHKNYKHLVWRTYKDYCYFLWFTWTRAIWNITILPTTFLDRISIIAFAVVASGVLFALFVLCLLINIPAVNTLYEWFSFRYANGVSMINCMHPEIFDELSKEEIQHAYDALSAPIANCPNTDTKRHFNLDIAKLLLQCSAVMYERTSAPLQRALAIETEGLKTPGHRVDTNPDGTLPGALLVNELGSHAATEVSKQLHRHHEENKMNEFAKKHGLEYATVSELNSQSSAVCGMFYDPNGTFIILAYKGTSPEEFSEWASDFTFEPKHAGHWIRGFGKCHGGFFSKIFPKRVGRGTRMPYNTIKHAVNVCAAQLLQRQPHGTQINVWTTGHSLGCALASLVYARQINEPGDFGRSVVVRDAYLFAAPILCDIHSVHAFNNRMHHASNVHGHHPRTMWRVTNGKDVVATALPHQGDHPEWGLSPYNLFSFAHLGTEIELRNFPHRCIVRGNHITPGSHVRVVSKFRSHNSPPPDHPEHAVKAKHERSLFARAGLRKLEQIPLIGRLISHGTAFYWVALRDVSVGSCEWDEE
ncbi:alpha/beta-hydrolase [Exidia glandulosa HHB12029]|uniref:Alpha/beta-hydrolase n=1 Tax=Exidia glandulosa HHB12029 TaxID=1314781 RepID=A0A165HZV0_EXIGL|nr:alpha/beta-hydrolase [Exidia glandulosa HHB12029]